MPVNIETKNKKTGEIVTKIYETVAERMQKFRKTYPIDKGWSLNTEMSHSDQLVRCEARIINPGGLIVATGHAEENRNGSYINQTSAVENCETSAIGRCLFTAGLGGGEFSSADELMTALRKQEEMGLTATGKLPNTGAKIPSGENGKGKVLPYKKEEGKPVNKEGLPDNTLKNLDLPEAEGVYYEKLENLVIAKGKSFSVKGLLQNKGFAWDPKHNAYTMCLI